MDDDKAPADRKTWKTKAAREDDARRRRSMHAVAATLPKVTGRAFGRRGFGEAGLIAQWDEIVGAQLAAVCLPRRLAFPSRKERKDGVLTLRVAPAHGLSVQHLEPMILERINGHMGYAAVTRLRLEQGPLPARRRPAARPAATVAPDPESAAALEARLADLDDADLAEAFRRLGQALSVARAEDGEDTKW